MQTSKWPDPPSTLFTANMIRWNIPYSSSFQRNFTDRTPSGTKVRYFQQKTSSSIETLSPVTLCPFSLPRKNLSAPKKQNRRTSREEEKKTAHACYGRFEIYLNYISWWVILNGPYHGSCCCHCCLPVGSGFSCMFSASRVRHICRCFWLPEKQPKNSCIFFSRSLFFEDCSLARSLSGAGNITLRWVTWRRRPGRSCVAKDNKSVYW